MSIILTRAEKAYGGMSKSQQRIMHYLKDHQKDLAFDSLAVFAEKTGSSEATVVRFARVLGYTGFADMQKSLQEELVAQAKGPEPASPPGDGDFVACADAARKAMAETYAGLDMEAFRASCELLMKADRVLITGYMDAFGVAAQALHMLDVIRPNVEFSRLLFETNGVYRHLHPGTTMFTVSFEPHYKFTYELMEMAERRGCEIILLTNSTLNPLARLADKVLCAKPVYYRDRSFLDVSAPVHLLTMMIRYMTEHWLEEIEQYKHSGLRMQEEFLE